MNGRLVFDETTLCSDDFCFNVVSCIARKWFEIRAGNSEQSNYRALERVARMVLRNQDHSYLYTVKTSKTVRANSWNQYSHAGVCGVMAAYLLLPSRRSGFDSRRTLCIFVKRTS